MPIIGRTPAECVNTFRRHVARLVSKTITTRFPGVAIAGPPRHHVHARAAVPVAVESLDLNKVHVPTGWVTIEEVIRFLIHELGVKPPCGKSWPSVLADSEETCGDPASHGS